MKYYLAYGSNLNIDRMNFRCPNAEKVGTFMLKGYELQFRLYLTIIPKEDGEVPIGVWAITEDDEENLDEYEGYPGYYRKEEIEFTLNGSKEKGIIYIMNDGISRRDENTPPTERYFNTCLDGYRDFGFDNTYLRTALAKCFE